MDLHDIREDYCKQALSQHDCDPNPIKQFENGSTKRLRLKSMSQQVLMLRQSMKMVGQQVEWCC